MAEGITGGSNIGRQSSMSNALRTTRSTLSIVEPKEESTSNTDNFADNSQQDRADRQIFYRGSQE
jgi:hypothetical protein